MALDAVSLMEFGVCFAIALIFSLIALSGFRKDESTGEYNYVVGLLGCFVAAPVWIAFSLLWAASSTADMFIPLSYLWVVLGILFIFPFPISYAALYMRGAARRQQEETLTVH
jgi:hypothetical protein